MGHDPASLQQSLQRGIERAIVDQEFMVGFLLQELRDARAQVGAPQDVQENGLGEFHSAIGQVGKLAAEKDVVTLGGLMPLDSSISIALSHARFPIAPISAI